MTPEHAKAFNELRELCRRYDFEMVHSSRGIEIAFSDGDYRAFLFNGYTNRINCIGADRMQHIPPPETKGDK